MDIAEVKKQWAGVEIDTTEYEARREQMLEYARACGETQPRFVDPEHADFQAVPTFVNQFVSRRVLPEDFPRLGPQGFDAGKCVECKAPVRAGDRLTARCQIADVYEKTGRSGPMYFIVHRTEFRNQREELVSIVDWRLVQQPARSSA